MIIPRGLPKHTSSFYLDKYRFAAGDHDLELRERESEDAVSFRSLSLIHCESKRKNSVHCMCQREGTALAQWHSDTH